MTRRNYILLGLLATSLLSAAGCLQIETRVQLQPDGSAVITERVRLSQRLLELGSEAGANYDVAPLLEKPAVLERMKQMGQGVELVSHQVRDAEGGSRESVAVFKIADLNNFVYASPYLAFADYPSNCLVKARLVPLLKSRNYAGSAGQMAVQFSLLKSPRGQEKPKEGEKPSGPTPAQLQILRALEPAFEDVMKDFRIRFTFESYAPILECGFGYRGSRERSRSVDLINFSADDMDKYGNSFLGNEEIMLDLLRGEVGSANIVDHTREYPANQTVPVFLPWGSANGYWHQSDEMTFAPSRPLFDKYFAGKKLDPARWAPGPPETHVPADFNKIGYKGEAK